MCFFLFFFQACFRIDLGMIFRWFWEVFGRHFCDFLDDYVIEMPKGKSVFGLRLRVRIACRTFQMYINFDVFCMDFGYPFRSRVFYWFFWSWGSVLAPFWLHFGTSWPIFGDTMESTKIFKKRTPLKAEKVASRTPAGSKNQGPAARGLTLWGCGKSSCSAKTWGFTIVKQAFRNMAFSMAVRKGELLRGKVSQGRPHPLSMALRCEGQTLEKKNIAER